MIDELWVRTGSTSGGPYPVSMVTLSDLSVALPLALAMLTVCWIGWRSQSSTSVAALVLLVWVWLQVNQDFEGGVLIKVTDEHGLVVADLFGLAVLAWALVLAVRARRARLT